jgi:hypothetical protein
VVETLCIDERILGLRCLDVGDASGAVQYLWAALESGSTEPDVAHYLGLSLCLAGDDDGFLSVVSACQCGPDAQLDFYHTILLDLMKRGAWDTLLRHAANTPTGTRLHAVATYYAGCAELARGYHDRALRHFSAFRQIVLPQHKNFPLVTDPKFNLVFRQACLLEPPEIVAEIVDLPTTNFSRGRPSLERFGKWTPPLGQVFLCCCDVAYFARFADELCQSMQRWRPDALLHFHIANLDEASFSIAADLAASHRLAINFSFESGPSWRHNVYYACNRFLVAPAIMDWYQRSLLILDADSILLGDLREITDAAPRFDFACFETGRTEPASVFQATLTHFANNDRARHLLEILARLIILKLDMPSGLSWMLDQAALYSAIRYAERFVPAIAVGDFSAITGRGLRSFIGGLGSEDEKAKMMVAAGSVILKTAIH